MQVTIFSMFANDYDDYGNNAPDKYDSMEIFQMINTCSDFSFAPHLPLEHPPAGHQRLHHLRRQTPSHQL